MHQGLKQIPNSKNQDPKKIQNSNPNALLFVIVIYLELEIWVLLFEACDLRFGIYTPVTQ
jgi:hypothetical protein